MKQKKALRALLATDNFEEFKRLREAKSFPKANSQSGSTKLRPKLKPFFIAVRADHQHTCSNCKSTVYPESLVIKDKHGTDANLYCSYDCSKEHAAKFSHISYSQSVFGPLPVNLRIDSTNLTEALEEIKKRLPIGPDKDYQGKIIDLLTQSLKKGAKHARTERSETIPA